jgi:hypothetical protein
MTVAMTKMIFFASKHLRKLLHCELEEKLESIKEDFLGGSVQVG